MKKVLFWGLLLPFLLLFSPLKAEAASSTDYEKFALESNLPESGCYYLVYTYTWVDPCYVAVFCDEPIYFCSSGKYDEPYCLFGKNNAPLREYTVRWSPDTDALYWNGPEIIPDVQSNEVVTPLRGTAVPIANASYSSDKFVLESVTENYFFRVASTLELVLEEARKTGKEVVTTAAGLVPYGIGLLALLMGLVVLLRVLRRFLAT